MKLLKGLFVFAFILTFSICCSLNGFRSKGNKISNIDDPLSYYNSVVRLIAEDEKQETGYIATGFAIDNDHLITAGHFCHGVTLEQILGNVTNDIYMERVDPTGKQLIRESGVTILKYDAARDICLMRKDNHGLIPIPIADSYEDYSIGDEVFTIGSPMGFFPMVSVGRIIDFSDVGALAVSLNIWFGNSGGPLISKGKIIGVIVGLPSSDYPHVGIATGLEAIKYILK